MPSLAKGHLSVEMWINSLYGRTLLQGGCRKVWQQLKREGFHVARCTVVRLMKTLQIKGVIHGKGVRTTRSSKAAETPRDLVNRQFVAERLNQRWVADFTYVST